MMIAQKLAASMNGRRSSEARHAQAVFLFSESNNYWSLNEAGFIRAQPTPAFVSQVTRASNPAELLLTWLEKANSRIASKTDGGYGAIWKRQVIATNKLP
jgi:hypothetical protein